MKKYKWLLSLVLMSSILLGGCSKTNKSSSNYFVTSSLEKKPVLVGNLPVQFPLVKDTASLNILCTVYGSLLPEDIYVWSKYEEMTGVKINWTTVRKKERDEKVNIALQNGTDLDLILRCKLTTEVLSKHGRSGQILDLAKDDLLQNFAPNCWAYLQSHPDALASVMNPDGTIYSIPQINSGAELRVSRKIFINKNWLKQVNMDVPTTTEEFYQMLVAFKEQDANGNGDFNDEIPLSSQDWSSIQEAFYGSFGLADRGVQNMTVDCDEKTGKVRFICASNEYRAFLEYFNRLYSEELLDSNIFTTTLEKWTTAINNDHIGVFVNTNLAALPAGMENNWISVNEALEGPFGDKMWSAVRANFHSTGAAVIPSTCDNPELVLKWLDYFWTDEGTLFYHMGIENETFIVRDDGSYDYTDDIYKQMSNENKSFDDIIATYSPYPGGSNPTIEIAPYFMGGEMAKTPASAARALFDYGPKEYWPSFTFTPEENRILERTKSDINKYCAECRIQFISGEKSLDDWNQYLDTLNSLEMSSVLKIYQAAVDRYNSLQQTQ